MNSFYLWLKAFHIIAVICWMAGIFYLPRLFVYHSTTPEQSGRDRFKVMEAKLYRIIMNPSMLVTLVLGVWMLVESWHAYSGSVWMWLKILLVVVLVGYHHYCLMIMRAFARDKVPHSEKFFRVFNEIPVLILIPVVILVTVKPF